MYSLDRRQTSSNGSKSKQPSAKASIGFNGSPPLSNPVMTQSSARTLRGTITTWNKAAELLFGYTAGEAIGQPITILIPLERQGEELSILDRTSRGERIENYETVRRRRDGSSVDVSLTISPVRNAEGTIVGASKIVRDITMRKRAEARETMLMAELDHRVKNILAQVAVVAKSTRQGSRSVDEFLRSLDGRIQSMAAAHTLLSQSGWQGVGVDALVRNQLAPYATDTNITISGTDVILAAAEVQALTRVLHELATNAAKYGALSDSERPGVGKLEAWNQRQGDKSDVRMA